MILAFYAAHGECIWSDELAERPDETGLVTIMLRAGINFPTRETSNITCDGEFLPVAMVVAARQRAIGSLSRYPSVSVRFYSPNEIIEVHGVLVAGTANARSEDFNANLFQVLQDAWVLLVQSGLPSTRLRHLANSTGAAWEYLPPMAPYPWGRDFPSSIFHLLARQSWYMQTLRQQLGNEDIDPNEDEPEDLPMLGGETVVNTRTFGLEFEFLPNGYPQEHYGEAIREALRPFGKSGQVVVRGYAHSDGDLWDLKTDSSCGYELATPALTWANWPEVEAVLLALQGAGARIDSRCGLHVHHMANDLRATGLRRLLLLWGAYERVLLASVKPERGVNRYCCTLEQQYSTWSTLKQALSPIGNLQSVVQDMGRYRALNATGWWQHGRIEVRLHHGTLQPGAVRFWTLLTQQMIEFAKHTRNYADMEEGFRAEFKLQLEQFKQTLTHRGSQHSDVTKLAVVLEEAIRRRNSKYLDGPWANTPTLSHLRFEEAEL